MFWGNQDNGDLVGSISPVKLSVFSYAEKESMISPLLANLRVSLGATEPVDIVSFLHV